MVALRYDVTVTSATRSSVCVMNGWGSPFNVGIGVISTSTGNIYTVQHTFNNPASSDFATGATWFDHADLASKTVSDDGNYAFRVSAVRLTATGGFDSGSVRMILLQAG